MERRPITVGEKIAARIERRGDCWIWTGRSDIPGQPSYKDGKRRYPIISTLWVQENGPVPEGHALACTHKKDHDYPCVNPRHYVATPIGAGQGWAASRPCGHDLTNPANVFYLGSRRLCLLCIQQRSLTLRQETTQTPTNRKRS